MDYIEHYHSPLGGITLASDGTAITGLWFDGQKHFAYNLSDKTVENPTWSVFEQTRRWLDLYFSGRCPDFTPPLKPQGTPFQQRVWKTLLSIPYGHTTTYGDIATHIVPTFHETSVQPARMSAQAVGQAVGRNPIAIIIPCHRVIGANGSLTGYAGGVDKKAWLLKLETNTDWK